MASNFDLESEINVLDLSDEFSNVLKIAEDDPELEIGNKEINGNIDEEIATKPEESYKFISPITPDNLEFAVGEGVGIKWFNNSCYIDTTLYSMFTFTGVFDYLLVPMFPPNYPYLEIGKTVQMIIRDKIVNPLRNGLMVPYQTIMEIRNILGKWDPGFISAEREPQEFLLTLFREILNSSPFLELANDNGSDFFHNILMESPPTFPEYIYIPSVNQIIEESFKLQNIQFKERPHPALMLPLPIFFDETGAHKPFSGIIPNLSIDITKFISNEYKCIICSEKATCELGNSDLRDQYYCDNCFEQLEPVQEKSNIKSEIKCELHLYAILCVMPNTRHFVSFVKCGPNRDAHWVFFNSMGGKNLDPVVEHLNNLGNLLNKLENDSSQMKIYMEKGDEMIRTLLINPYMYIYIPN